MSGVEDTPWDMSDWPLERPRGIVMPDAAVLDLPQTTHFALLQRGEWVTYGWSSFHLVEGWVPSRRGLAIVNERGDYRRWLL